MKHFYTVIITVILFLPLHSFAEIKEIISEGTYNMGDGETPGVAESRALLQAKRTALEQAGTYVESYTKVKNMQLTEDEIKVLSSGLMEVEILDKKRTIVREGEGIHFWVKIKAKVNPDKIEEIAKRVKEKSVVEDYKKIQEAYDKSQKDIEELKKQLAQAKGEKEKKQVEVKITDDERLFQANEWFNRGYEYGINKEYDKAIEAFTSSIALNPNYAFAYDNRGVAYSEKGQYDRAIEDFNKAIALDLNDDKAYLGRGDAYAKKGQYDKAIEDYNKAIELENTIMPDQTRQYKGGTVDFSLMPDQTRDELINTGEVVTDFQPVSRIPDRETDLSFYAYTVRGNAYHNKGQYDMAIEDYSKAIALGPNDAKAYYNRGLAYHNKGQYDMAIEDFNKAIALDPNLVQAYTNRGVAYALSGNMGRAISDFQKACDMGNKKACEALQMVLQNR